MLNGNKPKPWGLPLPFPALLMALIWFTLFAVNEWVYDLPRWLELAGIGASVVVLAVWLILGSRK